MRGIIVCRGHPARANEVSIGKSFTTRGFVSAASEQKDNGKMPIFQYNNCIFLNGIYNLSQTYMLVFNDKSLRICRFFS